MTLHRAHWFLTAAFLLVLFPLFRLAHLPFKVDFGSMAGAYWLGTGVRAVFCAVLLYLIAFPWRDTITPVLTRFRANKWLIVLAVTLGLAMVRLLGPLLGVEVIVYGIASAELMIRRQQRFGEALSDVAIPALYLFVGVMIAFIFQHGIAGIKYAASYDPFFRGIDRTIFRVDVSAISHFTLNHLPSWVQLTVEFFYGSLNLQLGGVMIFLSLASGRAAGIRYVATLLTAYYIALIIFAIWPTMGPFSGRVIQTADNPTSLKTFVAQETMVAKAKLILAHSTIPEVQSVNIADYYIGFPCLHIGLPIIAIWALRKWRTLTIVLACCDVLLVLSIVLLEWHYLIDLAGGVAVAALAIASQRVPNPIEQRVLAVDGNADFGG